MRNKERTEKIGEKTMIQLSAKQVKKKKKGEKEEIHSF